MSGLGPPLDLSGYQYGPSAAPQAVVEPGWYDRPRRAGSGPLEASSCTVLAIVPMVVFDVNGYYRALGFSFPYTGITRRTLREHYAAARGPDDPYLTEVFQLLLDEDVRRAYDRAPLGEAHLDRVQKRLLEERIKREALRRNPSFDTRATQHEIMREMGLEPDDDSSSNHYPEGDDKEPDLVHDEDLDQQPWLWGYYRWSSGCPDTGRLARWQSMIVSQLAAQEVSIRFCVGFCGRSRTDSRFVVHRTYGMSTAYLREDHEPDQDMAAAAAAALLDGN